MCKFYNEGYCNKIKAKCPIETFKEKSIKKCESIKDGTYRS